MLLEKRGSNSLCFTSPFLCLQSAMNWQKWNCWRKSCRHFWPVPISDFELQHTLRLLAWLWRPSGCCSSYKICEIVHRNDLATLLLQLLPVCFQIQFKVLAKRLGTNVLLVYLEVVTLQDFRQEIFCSTTWWCQRLNMGSYGRQCSTSWTAAASQPRIHQRRMCRKSLLPLWKDKTNDQHSQIIHGEL